MAGLKGRYECKVDAKGRVSIPSKHRKLLPEQLAVAMHPKKALPALVVYSEDGFDEWFDKILEAKGGPKADDALQDDLTDELYQSAQGAELDDLGRITISQYLRDYAGIKNQVVVSGARDHLIIRTPEILEKTLASYASNPVYSTSAAESEGDGGEATRGAHTIGVSATGA